MAHILLIEDDELVQTIVIEALRRNHHVVECIDNGVDGLERLLHFHYDLAIIDWEIPGPHGIELCQRYRNSGGQMPLLFLTAMTKIHQKVQALDTGADDYLCKPFSFEELISRVSVLLRRPPQESEKIITAQNLQLNLTKGLVTVNGADVQLTAHEYEILRLLMQSPEQVFTPAQILNRLADDSESQTEHSIRQRIMLLRKKLSDSNASVVTVRGVGYKFDMGQDGTGLVEK